MCQVDDGDATMRKELHDKNVLRKECVKCRSPQVVIPHGGTAALCRPCFLAHISHKFRATIAKGNVVRQGDQVLLAYSGGAASGAMLSLIREGLKPETKKKLRFKPCGVVYVDERLSLVEGDEEQSEAATRRRLTSIRQQLKTMAPSGCPVYVTSLECVMLIGTDSENLQASDVCVDWSSESGVEDVLAFLGRDKIKTAGLALMSLFDNLQTSTSRKRIVEILRHKLLSRVSRCLGSPHLMVGLSASRVAIGILTDLALGRGTQISQDVGFCDARFNGSERVTIVRPLREFADKEIAVYNQLLETPTLAIKNLDTMTTPQSSIQRATEDFIVGLQKDFSSTVSTVCKTGEKLGRKTEAVEDGTSLDCCCLCSGPLDASDAALNDAALLKHITDSTTDKTTRASAARAIDVSRVVSSLTADNCVSNPSPGCCGQGDGSCTSKQNPAPQSLANALCFSCRAVALELEGSNVTSSSDRRSSGIESLPPFVVEGAISRGRREKMRNQIQEFLLDDDE